MGTRTFAHYYSDKVDADEAASVQGRKDLSCPGYSEVYLEDGPRLANMTDGSQMWKVTFKEYYG